jgi:DNA uptake protein ComE-like DNA-binding protein
MSLYTPRQLLLILLLVGAAGAGLAIDHARRARPELVERLERVDRVERPDPTAVSRPPDAAAAASERRAGPRASARAPRESARARRVRPTAPAEPVDINRASEPELVRLPGVGPALAARIIEARPFGEVDDLRRVRGLRLGLFERLRPLVVAGTP